jgi:hypothetical protein
LRSVVKWFHRVELSELSSVHVTGSGVADPSFIQDSVVSAGFMSEGLREERNDCFWCHCVTKLLG